MIATQTKAEVKERPILFSGPMIRAILEGRKTQTRRVVPVQPQSFGEPKWWEPDFAFARRPPSKEAYIAEAIKRCRYGQPGERLWVRETFLTMRWRELGQYVYGGRPRPPVENVYYRADDKSKHFGVPNDAKWKPSIFMPRWASRITLEITEVRVERLQEISEADAKAEGVPPCPVEVNNPSHIHTFESGWNAINAKRGYSWESNLWVWAISFRVM